MARNHPDLMKNIPLESWKNSYKHHSRVQNEDRILKAAREKPFRMYKGGNVSNGIRADFSWETTEVSRQQKAILKTWGWRRTSTDNQEFYIQQNQCQTKTGQNELLAHLPQKDTLKDIGLQRKDTRGYSLHTKNKNYWER